MQASSWARELLMRQAYETMMEVGLSNATRRKEIRAILDSAAKHTTDAMRYDATRLIREHQRQIEDRKRAKAAAKSEPRPPAPEGAKVIPIRRDG